MQTGQGMLVVTRRSSATLLVRWFQYSSDALQPFTAPQYTGKSFIEAANPDSTVTASSYVFCGILSLPLLVRLSHCLPGNS
eukprot:g82177.t1